MDQAFREGRMSATSFRLGAREWLDASYAEARSGRRRVAFEAARHAAELSAKARLIESGRAPRREHNVAPDLVHAKLVPRSVDAARLSRLLSAATLGTYGFEDPLRDGDLEELQRYAEALLSDE